MNMTNLHSELVLLLLLSQGWKVQVNYCVIIRSIAVWKDNIVTQQADSATFPPKRPIIAKVDLCQLQKIVPSLTCKRKANI